ncbi:MAG TPA: translocation/assembly module TamB, partial [Myxococcota bacterium]|nr:translocation/assembly module TamB [Myxococcota bacterium]
GALCGAAALGAGLLAIGLFALSRGWQRERVVQELQRWANHAWADAGLCGELRIGELRGPLYPELALEHVAWTCRGETVAEVRSAELRLDLTRVWSQRRVIVEQLRIEGARLAVAPDTEERWPWRPAPAAAPGASPAPEPRPVALELRDVVLEPAEVVAAWTQAGQPSRIRATVSGQASQLALPRAGAPPWPGSARVALALDPGIVGGRELRGAELALSLRGSQLAIEPSHFESAFGTVHVEGETDLAGWLDPAARASIHLEARADALDLAVLTARRELAGRVAGTLRVDASHTPGSELRESRAELALALAPSRIGRLEIAGGDVRGVYDAGRWRVERARLRSSAGRLELRGNGDLQRIAALDGELELSDLAALATVVGAQARGALRAKLSAAGAWDAPSGALELEARELAVEDVALGRVSLRARSADLARYRIESLVLDGPRLALSADGPVLLRRSGSALVIERANLRFAPGETLALTGGLSAAGARDLRLQIGHVALARVGAFAGLQQTLGGRVSGALRANGAWPRPALEGKLAWDAPRVGQVAVDAISLELASRDGMLAGDGKIAAAGRELLQAHFALPWSAQSALAGALANPRTQLEIRGEELELALFRDLVPDMVQGVAGTASLRVDLRGGEREPVLGGELRVAGVAWDLPALGQHFGPLDARLLLSKDAVRIDRCTLRAGEDRSAELTGLLRLVDLRPDVADLQLGLHAFPLRWQTNLQAQASGEIALGGPLDALSARGEVTLRGLHYSLAGGADPLLGEVTVRDSRLPARPERPLLETSRIYAGASVDVKVDIADDGRVQGQGANLEIAGQLVASKSPDQPLVLRGAIDTTHGSYRIRGKTFLVERAHVEFTGRPDLDPDIDVRAMHRVRDIRVYALVRGRASAPSIQLSSDPPYPQDDVLALLLFGKTRDELDQQQASAVQSAVAGTAGAALESVTSTLGIDVPLDTVVVENSTTNGETTVGLGGYVTKDIYVGYGRGIGSDADNNVRIDWRFHPRWSVETSISTRGDSSADLVWTYDY